MAAQCHPGHCAEFDFIVSFHSFKICKELHNDTRYSYIYKLARLIMII